MYILYIMGNVPYMLYKVCCLQILKPYFDCVICNASVAQWESFRQKLSLFLLSGRPLVQILVDTNIFGHFLAKSQKPSAAFFK